ncbi:MAG TPA: DUF5666 domain-containing protein [Candidatus Aquilonibacter sp.]|nr:DUF5666 domain-containing protein [Candidatus Aquilonibacter sp.]
MSRRIGAVKAINGTSITLTPDSGADVTVTIQPAARILRIAPGEKNLKNATPIQLQDIQVGDRILVGGKASDDNSSLAATTVVVMKQSDLEAKHEQERQDWQKRGVDGVAGAVDAAAGTVTITVRSKNVVIHTSSTTLIRRYPPDSVKFDDAKPSTLQEIHTGDQVRARGDRSPDGGELSAEEIVSGSFRNIAGIIDSVDASSSTLSVHDLLSKKNVLVKITPDSQLHQLPPEMAQRIAARLKGGAAGASSGAGSTSATNPQGANGQNAKSADAPGANGGNSAGGRPGGTPDFQQMLSRIPPTSLANLHKGDAVVIVSTEGAADQGTVITLLSGVEPILRAAPSASSYALLTPWSLGAPAGDAGGP